MKNSECCIGCGVEKKDTFGPFHKVTFDEWEKERRDIADGYMCDLCYCNVDALRGRELSYVGLVQAIHWLTRYLGKK